MITITRQRIDNRDLAVIAAWRHTVDGDAEANGDGF